MRLDDNEYACRGCDETINADRDPSPCEGHKTCAWCSERCEECEPERRLMASGYEAWAAL